MARALRIGHALTSYDTQFPATENPMSQGSRWRVGGVTGFYKNPRTTPGKCFAADTVGAGFDDCLAQLLTPDVPANQYAEMTVFREAGYDTPGDTHENGLYLRIDIGAEFVRGYEFLFEAQGSFQIVRWEGTTHESGNFTVLSPGGSSPGVLAHGDVIRVTAIGSQLRAYKNSVEFADVVDTTWADGAPGMGFFVRPTGTTPANYCMSRYRAGAAS